MADRNLKLIVGYAAWREWRWSAHRKQLQNDRNPRAEVSTSAAVYVGSGIFMLLLSIPWILFFATSALFPLFFVMNLMWNLVAVFVIVAGWRETHPA